MAQTVLFSDPGKTYTNTDGRTLDIYGPVNISDRSSVRFEIDYNSSLPCQGSGNMESSDECVFVIPPCAGDPNNSLIGGCAQCWDFFWGQFMIDGAQVGGDLVGEAGTTDAEQSGSVSLDYCTKGAASVASINATTQTWANNESVTFSGIMIICYVGVPTGDTSFASVCVGAMVDLSPFIQNGDPSGQFFDIDNSMSLKGPISNSANLAGQVFRFKYKVDGDKPCGPDSTILEVKVLKELTEGKDSIISICHGDSDDLLQLLTSADLGDMFIDPMSVGALFNNHWYSQIRCVGQFSILYRVGDGIICPIDEPELIIEVKDAILIDPVMDLSTCDFFVLRQITGSNTQFANYFLQPQGMGSMLQSGDRIKSSIRIYLYGQQNRFLQ